MLGVSRIALGMQETGAYVLILLGFARPQGFNLAPSGARIIWVGGGGGWGGGGGVWGGGGGGAENPGRLCRTRAEFWLTAFSQIFGQPFPRV